MAGKHEIFGDLLLAADIDKAVHEPARLMILSMLHVIDSADFTFLHRQSGLTRGNFSTHITRLQEAGYVGVEKAFVDRKPLTTYKITQEGRAALETYRKTMLEILAELE